MKTNFKRVMSLVLTVLMVMTVVPFAGVSAEGEWDCEADGHEFYGELVLKSGKHARWCEHCDEYGYTVYNSETEETTQVVGFQECCGGYATCSELAVCNFCNRKYGDYDDNCHDFTLSDDKHLASEATCVSKAKYFFSCSWCGDSANWHADEDTDWDDITYTKGAVDRVTGHRGEAVANDDDTHFIDECYLCGETDITAPCSGDGANCQEKATCWQCGEKYGEVDTTRHSRTDWEDYKEATCQAPGYYSYEYCVDCNAITSEKEEIPQLDHTYPENFTKDEDADTHSKTCTTCNEELGEVSVIRENCTGGTANCTTKATCEVCNAVYGDVKHTWDNGTVTAEPTCSAKGSKLFECTVENCDATKTEEIAISEGAHSWGTELHKTENQKHYVVCAHNAEHKNHINCSATTTVVTAPTCTADGYTTYTCACGNTWTGAATPATGHNYTKKVQNDNYLLSAATCQKRAVYYYVCANGTCGMSAKDATETNIVKTYEYGNELEHSWNEGTVTTAATCVAAGVKTFTCTTCNPEVATVATKTETLTIDANAHDWNDWTKTDADKHKRVCKLSATHVEEENCKGGTATCTAKAICSVCKDTYGAVAAHKYTQKIKDDAHKKSDATCTAKATYWFDCATCDKSASTDTTAADKFYEDGEKLPHSYTVSKVDEKYLAVAATCSTKAIYYKSCACGDSGVNSEKEAVFEHGDALGHLVETIPGKDPTCTEDGYTESRICKRPTGENKTCGAVLKEKVVRKATGHKEYISVEKTEATCTKVGHTEEKKCAVCEKLLTTPSVTTNALGHVDADDDELCDRAGCGTIMSKDDEGCSCLCHGTGLSRILYVFVKLIWKLIGANQHCDCGVEHY